ncbi:hypothetical protein CRG98_028368 [Punica granatum]|uniref:Uncharacterized protein n=1 Tax=Punica granatum TaxID=22663 RepID=A0A2I0J5M7_PUNGR|nr:hypothetical protein CRG98_028368 [Punica granatum]
MKRLQKKKWHAEARKLRDTREKATAFNHGAVIARLGSFQGIRPNVPPPEPVNTRAISSQARKLRDILIMEAIAHNHAAIIARSNPSPGIRPDVPPSAAKATAFYHGAVVARSGPSPGLRPDVPPPAAEQKLGN